VLSALKPMLPLEHQRWASENLNPSVAVMKSAQNGV
jgi:hypothetical protein